MDEPGNIRITSVELLDNEPLKRFALVMPVCEVDYKLAIKTLAWACRLEAPKAGVMLLLPDNLGGNRIAVLRQLASPLADRVEVVPQLAFPGTKEWPAGPNAAFVCAYNAVETHDVDAWLFFEPDSVPTKNTWTSELYKAFKESGKPVLGSCIKGRPPLPSVGVNGVAVYSKALQREMINAVIDNMDKPFDVVLSRLLGPRNIGCSDLIQFRLGRNRVPLRWTEMSDINPNAVLVHSDKFGDVVNLLSTPVDPDVDSKDEPQRGEATDQKVSTITEAREKKLRMAYMVGDYGDIVYALPTIKAMGGGVIVLGPCRGPRLQNTREPMTRKRASQIIPLLNAQDYVHGAFYGEFQDDMIDFEPARRWHMPPIATIGQSLADRTSLWFLNKDGLWREKWLACQPKRVAAVVMNRTSRWHGSFDWKRTVQMFKDDCVFVGTKDEHDAFVKEFGEVPYQRTRDLLELASVVNGADIFVGNQSVAYAIAEGLKKTAIVEESTDAPDCAFRRPSRYSSIDEYVADPKRRNAGRD